MWRVALQRLRIDRHSHVAGRTSHLRALALALHPMLLARQQRSLWRADRRA